MPLDYAEFSHYYEAPGSRNESGRAQFDALIDVLECIVRLYWQNEGGANALGITLDGDVLLRANGLDLNDKLITAFNRTAPLGEARKKES